MYDCIIIGAGPGGIVCAKELIENGINNIVCLEREPGPGGTFAKTYDNLMLTSSAVMSMYSDFWIGDGQVSNIWTKKEALDYWQRYADHFQVSPRIRFNTRVTSVESEADETWQVETAAGERLQAKRLVIATGANTVPRFPDWKEAITSPEVQILHSQQYKNADALRGKRVLVVGGGESGTDIALEISRVASQCWISLRGSTGWVTPRKRGKMPADIATHRGVWGLPRSYGEDLTQALLKIEQGRNTAESDAAVLLNKKISNRLGMFGTYGTKSFALPTAMTEFGCKLVGEIVDVEAAGRRLKSRDGHSIDDLDAIVFCTGFTSRNDFLPDGLQQIVPRSHYKHMFHPDYGLRLCWIGWARPNFGSQFPIMEMQARYYAQLLKGACELPEPSAMSATIKQDRDQFENQFQHNAKSIVILVDYRIYMDGMAKLLGCAPPFWRYLLFHPNIWRKIVFGALQGAQFRLTGLGSKPELAREILRKCPSLPLDNILLRLGLKSRLICGWRKLLGGKFHHEPHATGAKPASQI